MKKVDAPMHQGEGERPQCTRPKQDSGVKKEKPPPITQKTKKTGILSRLFRSIILPQEKHDIQ